MNSFSERHGLSVPEGEIRVRNDAPSELREVIPTICYKAGMQPKAVRAVLCDAFLRAPNPANWSDFPNIDGEVHELLRDCTWFEVYDAIEAMAAALKQGYFHQSSGPGESAFEDNINRFFRREGIGWQLTQGRIEMRGPEAFELAVHQAQDLLQNKGKKTAASELHEAIVDLSRRPNAEITGAIQHAMAALECVARDKGQTKDTLGDLIKRNRQMFPQPIDAIVEKAWGWTSNHGRHLQEGDAPSFEEAELMVGISAVLCRYLGRRL